MARKATEEDLAKTRRRYPWHEWSNGETWILVRGEDYSIPDKSMVSNCHSYANYNNMMATVRTHPEGLMVRFSSRTTRRVKRTKKFSLEKKKGLQS